MTWPDLASSKLCETDRNSVLLDESPFAARHADVVAPPSRERAQPPAKVLLFGISTLQPAAYH